MLPPYCPPNGGTVGDSTPPHPPDQTSSSQLKLIMQIGTHGSAHRMYIMVVLTLMVSSWFNVECGSSASGRRRSLYFEVHSLNLPQVLNLREVRSVLSPEVQLRAEQCKLNPHEYPRKLEDNFKRRPMPKLSHSPSIVFREVIKSKRWLRLNKTERNYLCDSIKFCVSYWIWTER